MSICFYAGTRALGLREALAVKVLVEGDDLTDILTCTGLRQRLVLRPTLPLLSLSGSYSHLLPTLTSEPWLRCPSVWVALTHFPTTSQVNLNAFSCNEFF